MGGRGSSSGISSSGNEYGSQYHTILQSGNVKFVSKNNRQSESLMETMTNGRVYATVGGKEVIRVTFFDKANKRNKVIEKDKTTGTWHVHKGYFHSDSHDPVKGKDKKVLDNVLRKWQHYR